MSVADNPEQNAARMVCDGFLAILNELACSLVCLYACSLHMSLLSYVLLSSIWVWHGLTVGTFGNKCDRSRSWRIEQI